MYEHRPIRLLTVSSLLDTSFFLLVPYLSIHHHGARAPRCPPLPCCTPQNSHDLQTVFTLKHFSILKIIILRNCLTCFNGLLFVPILVPGDRAVGSFPVTRVQYLHLPYLNITNGKYLEEMDTYSNSKGTTLI